MIWVVLRTDWSPEALALDVASSRFFQDGSYHLDHGEGGPCALDADGMIDLMEGWLHRYPLIAIEDPMCCFMGRCEALAIDVLVIVDEDAGTGVRVADRET